MANKSTNLFTSRATLNYQLRDGLLKQLYPTIPNPYSGSGGSPRDKQNQILSDLAQSFSRYAGNQQTAFDNGAGRSNANSNSGNLLELQVDRAIAQVLGRAPGRGSDSFVSALNNAFPTLPTNGQVASKPSRSTVSLYNSSNTNGGTIGDLAQQLPARQATLYRQASIVAADALSVLAGLQAFMPEAVVEQVEALRMQVRLEFTALVDEFGRIEEPRPNRVLAYFDALALHLTELGRRAFLDDPKLAATPEDEAQIAGFNLLKNYRATFRSNWETFSNADKSNKTYSLSERVERATIMLPIIATSNADFEAAMDSVDFSETDRRSMVSKFIVLNKVNLGVYALPQPDLTVYDLTEWLDRFANLEGPSSLAESGQYGLDFVTDQADRLFWVIAPVVGYIKTTKSALSSGQTTLEQVLSNERVGWALNNLLDQLDGLADLAVPGINP